MIKRVPLLPMSMKTAVRLSRPLQGIGRKLVGLKPSLKAELVQIDAGVEPEEYMSVTILSTAYSFVLMLLVLYLISLSIRSPMDWTSYCLALLFAGFIGWQTLSYPSLLLRRKVGEINRDLLFALRHMLIQVKSGIPLYTSFVSISEAEYGVISKEFRITAAEINAGVSQSEALEHMAMRNPSTYLRRAIWQINNAVKTGADIGETLEELVQEFTADEITRLRKFGKELSPWTLMYMLLTVVFPTMGISLFLVLGSFAAIKISNFTLTAAIVLFVVFQVFFIKFIKNKRPVVNF